MNMINTNLWDKYKTLIKEDSFDMPNVERPEDIEFSFNEPVDKQGAIFNTGLIENNKNQIITELFENAEYEDAAQMLLVFQNIVRSEINKTGLEEDDIAIAKEIGYSDEDINELNAYIAKYHGNAWRPQYMNMALNILSRKGKTYNTYSYANPKYIADPKEALDAGCFFEPAALFIINHSNEDIEKMQLTEELSLDTEEITEEDIENLDSWNYINGFKDKYAYTDVINSDENGRNYFELVKLVGPWKGEILEPDKLSYLISSIKKNKRNLREVAGGDLDIQVVINGPALETASGNENENPFEGDMNFPGTDLTITGKKDTIYIQKKTKESDKEFKILEKIISKAAEELAITEFSSENYLYSIKGRNRIPGIQTLWASPLGDELLECWSVQSTNYNRSEKKQNLYISTYGRSTSITSRQSELWELFENHIFNGEYVPFNTKEYAEVLKKEIMKVDSNMINKGLITDEELYDMAKTSYFLNGIKDPMFADIRYGERYKIVFRTFRYANFYEDILNKKNIRWKITFDAENNRFIREDGQFLGLEEFDIDHIDGNHGNDYFGNLRLVTKDFNNNYRNTIGIFKFILTPRNQGIDKDALIEWSLDFDENLNLVLPIGRIQGGENSPLYVYNNFGGFYNLDIQGSDSMKEYSSEDITSFKSRPGETVTLQVKGVSVLFNNKKNRKVFVGAKDLAYSGLINVATQKKLLPGDEYNLQKAISKKSGSSNNFSLAFNTDAEMIDKIITEKYKALNNIANRFNDPSPSAENGQIPSQQGHEQQPYAYNKPNNADDVPDVQNAQQAQNAMQTDDDAELNNTYMPDNETDTQELESPEVKEGKSLFSEIISEVTAKKENDDSSNNRIKQVKAKSIFKNLTLEGVASEMIKIYNISKNLSDGDSRNIKKFGNSFYSVLHFGLKNMGPEIEEYEGNSLDDWKEAVYIDIGSKSSADTVTFSESEKRWKVRELKQRYAGTGDGVVRVSKLGRFAIEKNGKLEIKDVTSSTTAYPQVGLEATMYRTGKDGRNIWDYDRASRKSLDKMDVMSMKSGESIKKKAAHVTVASTWKKQECEDTINKERTPDPNDAAPISLKVHHINGNQTDMRVDNLEWVTPGDNTTFDSGKGIALFRVVPGTGEETPLIAWPKQNECIVVDRETNKPVDGNVFVDKIRDIDGTIVTTNITIPKIAKERLLKTNLFRQGELRPRKISYFMRRVTLLDRKTTDRTPYERIQDIIGYEYFFKGRAEMINDSDGEITIIPSRLEEIEDESLINMYFRSNVGYEMMYEEANRRGEKFMFNFKTRMKIMSGMNDERRIFNMNRMGYSISSMSKEDQALIWNVDESLMLPEDRLQYIFEKYAAGNVFPLILTEKMQEQIYELYLESNYSDIIQNKDRRIKGNDLKGFLKASREYYDRTSKIMSNKKRYHIGETRYDKMAKKILTTGMDLEELNDSDKAYAKKIIFNELKRLSGLKFEEKVEELQINNYNISKRKEPEFIDLVWNSKDGILNPEDMEKVMEYIKAEKILLKILPENTIRIIAKELGFSKANDFTLSYNSKLNEKMKGKRNEGIELKDKIKTLIEQIDKIL